MQGNSYRQINNSSSAELYRGRDLETFSQVQAPPVTAQPHFSRICNRMGNCDQTNSRSNVIGGKSLMNYAAAYGQSIKPWLRTPYHSDQNTRSGSSDSVIINFDNISEQSTSHPVDPYGFYVNKIYPERCEHTVPSTESSGLSDHLNLSDNIREINVDIPNHNRSYSSHEHNSNSSNNNSNNNNNDNGNSNNDDNNDNISNESNNNNNNSTTVIQNNEGTHTESPSPGTQSLEKIINKYIPFITFVLLKAIYDHREGILIFVALLITFIHANYVVKREIAKQSRRSLISLGIIFVNLFVSICFIYFVFRDQHLYKNLIFIPPYSQPISIWDVLWIVGITDFVLKFITIQLKVGMTCFPAKLLPYSARGKWYLMLERTSQLYRGLVPIQPWLYYLTEVYQGPDSIVGMFFSVAYVVSKGSDIKSKVKLFLKAFLKLLHSASLGVRPSNEQLVSAGSQCPICHDEYNSPIILQCRHVFCESCVSTWFDREQTCPLCRAKIADDPSWRDGATSLFTQLF